jgi:valyl-tRNA synthetase
LERIVKEIARIEKDLEKSHAKLSNPQFVEKAPAEVVERERQFTASLEQKREKLLARRAMLGG